MSIFRTYRCDDCGWRGQRPSSQPLAWCPACGYERLSVVQDVPPPPPAPQEAR